MVVAHGGPDRLRVLRPRNAAQHPSVMGPERFPPRLQEDGRVTPSVGAAHRTPLSRSSSPSRSFCLRVSGAVAPSAPRLMSVSPARDHVLARARAPPGGRPCCRHHRWGSRRSQTRSRKPRDLLTFFREPRCPEGPESGSKRSKVAGTKPQPRGRAAPCPFRTGCDGRHRSG